MARSKAYEQKLQSSTNVTHLEDFEVHGDWEDDRDSNGQEGANQGHEERQERHKSRSRQTAAREECAHYESPYTCWHSCTLQTLHLSRAQQNADSLPFSARLTARRPR